MVAKKAATKKPVKKAPAKKAPRKKKAEMKSFRIYKEQQEFTRLQFTRQTLYWTILLVFIIVTQLWMLKVQIDIANATALLLNP